MSSLFAALDRRLERLFQLLGKSQTKTRTLRREQG